MNKRQQVIVVAAAVMMVAMLLYPPFRFINYQGVEYNLGYGWIFSPRKTSGGNLGHVNVALLVVQWAAVVVVAGALYVVLAARRMTASPEKAPPQNDPSPIRAVEGSLPARINEAAPTAAFEAAPNTSASETAAEGATHTSASTNQELRAISAVAKPAAGFVIALLRLARAFAGAFAVLQVVGMLPLLSWLENPSGVTPNMLAILAIKLAVLAACIGAFVGFRMLINLIHEQRVGGPHPSLNRRLGL